MKTLTKNEMLKLVGNSNGSYKNVYNKARKLLDNWLNLTAKMERLIVRGNGKTLVARCAFGLLVMMETGIRIGNHISANGYISTNKWGKYHLKEVKTYGLITLNIKHIKKVGNKLVLNFLGKKQVQCRVETKNKILLKYFGIVKFGKKQDDLFLDIRRVDLMRFVRKYVGGKYSPKDMRTAKVNQMFIEEVIFPKGLLLKKEVNAALKKVLTKTADRAGHTAGVCKGRYVSPDLLFEYKETMLAQMVENKIANKGKK